MSSLLACAVLLAGLILIDLVCACLDAFSITGAIWRFIHSKLRGTRTIEIPDELSPAIANRLIGKGSELIAGENPGWTDGSVRRFPISARCLRVPEGTLVRIESLSRRRMEIRILKS